LEIWQTILCCTRRSFPSKVFPIVTKKIKENVGAIWISNTYRSGRLMDARRLLARLRGKEEEFLHKVQKEVNDSFDSVQFPGLRQIIPSFKDGGCYVTFASKEQAKQVIQELHGHIKIHGLDKKAFLVQGRPFIEDLTHRRPSPKISVELLDIAKTQQRLSQELLYQEMRQYGRMQDINIDSKKETAMVVFNSTNSAISARYLFF
jgi:hypothetical protein